MPSSTVENYIKQLYLTQQTGLEGGLVPMGQLASAMTVSPGTATSMIKTLAAARLVHYEPRNGVRLTQGGEQLALHVLRRHRLVELFLVRVLGLDWSEVHEEAEALEHAISDRVVDRMDAILGHPEVDPHGDPIPSAQGQLQRRTLDTLSECTEGQALYVSRVLDQNPDFLRFLDQRGLVPGCSVMVKSRDTQGDAVQIEVGSDENIALGFSAASKILVQPEQPH